MAQGEAAWQAYLLLLDITSHQAVKLLTEAALLASAIEQGLSPDLIILSDGAKQFAILVHALSLRCIWNAASAVCLATPPLHRQEIEAVQADLWDYYRQLRNYQDQPLETEQQRLRSRFDEIFGQRYPHHSGLNLALQQFCAHKEELLRVLDPPQVPLHTNAAEADIREYVTRRFS